MKKEVNIRFSGQALDLLHHIPKINPKDVVTWFVKVRRISIGGGDVLEYLKHLREQKK